MPVIGRGPGLVLLAPMLVAAAAPIDAIDAIRAGFPELVNGAGDAGPAGCKAVRALRLVEVKPPWRGRIARISLKCEPFSGVGEEPDVKTLVVATMKPGMVAIAGVPVVRFRGETSAMFGDNQFILAGRYRTIGARIAARARADCMRQMKGEAPQGERCAIRPDPTHGGVYVETGELGGIWVHPDPANPLQTVYADAWSD